jgi:hypothetical protein
MKTLMSIGLVLLASASSAHATAQYPDKIVYESTEYSLHTNPMESYFSTHPEKKPTGGVVSTALWRGYVATFEFEDDILVLKDIEIRFIVETDDGKQDTKWKSVRDQLLPGEEVLPIDWFTGILVLPYGELVNYIHMGYGSTYSNYILLEIRNGKLTGKRIFDDKQYEEFKEKQFQSFKRTEAYKERVGELRKERDDQEFIDSFLRSFVVDYTSKFLDEEESPNPMDVGDGK